MQSHAAGKKPDSRRSLWLRKPRQASHRRSASFEYWKSLAENGARERMGVGLDICIISLRAGRHKYSTGSEVGVEKRARQSSSRADEMMTGQMR